MKKRIVGLTGLAAIAALSFAPLTAFAASYSPLPFDSAMGNYTGSITNPDNMIDGNNTTYSMWGTNYADAYFQITPNEKIRIVGAIDPSAVVYVKFLNSSGAVVGSTYTLPTENTLNSPLDMDYTAPTNATVLMIEGTSGATNSYPIYEVEGEAYTPPVDGTANSQASITGAPLSITAPTLSSDFGTFTLNGQVETKSATLSNWDVVDPTGTQSGWNVTIQASAFTEVAPAGGFASGTSAMTLPQGSLTLSGTRTITAATGATPVDATNGPLLENQTSAIDAGTPVQIIDTQAGYGSGKYTINEPSNGLTLTVSPQSAKVDTMNYPSAPTPFQTTLTYSIVSGP